MHFFRTALIAACLIGTAAANAAVIGSTTSAKNNVNGKLGTDVRDLNAGDTVSGNEVVTTGSDSAALLKFLDNTNLNIGAGSTVVLDRFIFNPDGSAQNAVINLTKGAMRFVTGNSNPDNFQINTNVATIGIRGTDFIVICDGIATCLIAVTKGIVEACPHPDTPIDGCGDLRVVDTTNNFILIGPGGTRGAQPISDDIVARLYEIIANGGQIDLASLLPGDVLLPLLPPVSPSPG